MHSRHKTTTLNYFNEYSVEIDSEIVDLIEAMWKAGIETSGCCQEEQDARYNKMIYIQFENSESCKKFLNIITDYHSPNNEGELELWNAVYHEDGFKFRMNIVDRNFFIVDNKADFQDYKKLPKRDLNVKHNTKFDINVNMWFNKKYKAIIIEKLKDYCS